MTKAGDIYGDALGRERLVAHWFYRRASSGAEGCGFDPRLAYQSSLATKWSAMTAAPKNGYPLFTWACSDGLLERPSR